jgi:putative DNA primase/helicase
MTATVSGNQKAFNLTEQDRCRLEGSYITPEFAIQAGIYRVDSVEGALLVGRKGSGDFSGIAFPYVLPGASSPREHRLRRDHPDLELQTDGSHKETGKYLAPPGRGNMLYFMPKTPSDWLRDTMLPICLTEGEKKTIALYRLSLHNVENDKPRFFAIGVSGVWNWRGVIGKVEGANGERRDEKGTIADLELIDWKGRTVYIIFDTNVATNDSVRQARRSLSKDLMRRGAIVSFVEMPQEEGINGIDDYLGKYDAEAGLDLISNAKRSDYAAPAGFRLSESGLWMVDPTGEKDDLFICSPLKVEAVSRNRKSEEWGKLLVFDDPDGVEHFWLIPMSLVIGEMNTYQSKLASLGLVISPIRKARELLTTYIQTANPEARVRCVNRIGWHSRAFVLPDKTFGESDERIMLQSLAADSHQLNTSGSLAEWREQISCYCVGNSRLVFAVSCAFAGAILTLVGEQGGGFHYRSKTTDGKTTALIVAGSVWGGGAKDGYLRRWKATANGLEAICELHNDSLLCLDELSELDPKEAGAVAYMLANGSGKARMSRNVTARQSLEWNLLFLSSGEESLADMMQGVGRRMRGGQEVRMCDLNADAGLGLGVFEELHSFPSAKALADHFNYAARKYYGTAIRQYLLGIVGQQDEIRIAIPKTRSEFINRNVPKDAASEVIRAASRFALVGIVGESARNITGWQKGEAIKAAETMFKTWLEGRGTQGNSDLEAAIRQVRGFIEAHGASRFQSRDEEKIIHRVGFKEQNDDGETEYLILPEAFRREVCAGYDATMTAKVLAERGHLLKGDGRNYTQKKACGELGRTRVYVIRSSVLEIE